MECNKDEAIRAKSIAEQKMEKNDFLGARRIALKAKSLYPELENISQLISICDVHCSAHNRVLGSEKDWYGILQVEKLADELTVKKQYRRLALSLHPDKNRFPGAEGAFKLICEANTVLSDPTKKSAYDNKIRFIVKSGAVNPHSHHVQTSSQCKKQNNAQHNASNGFSNMHQHQAAQPGSSVREGVFWTACPFCGVRYQYLKQFVRKSLRCQTCAKVFVGHEISIQRASVDSKSGQSNHNETSRPGGSQSAASQEKVAPKQGNLKTSIPNEKRPSASQAGTQGTSSGQTVNPKPGAQAGRSSEGVASPPNAKEDVKTKNSDMQNGKSFHNAKEGGSSNGDATLKRKISDPKNKAKGRKLSESENSDFSSESELEDMVEPSCDHSPRRSSRKRQNVSYNEIDEEGVASLKRPQATKENQGNAQKNASDNYHAKHDNQDSFHKQDNDEEGKSSREKYVKSSAKTYEDETDLQKDSSSTDGPAIYCPDPEFSDFDNVREENKFAANQFWACYDTLDDMPRFYAKVKKVCRNPFSLIITWLEAVPISGAFGQWVKNELPVGCGTFKFGQTEETPIRLSFSHQVHCEKGQKRGSLVIYPRVGEIWAIFQDWNTNWASNPEKHVEFKYEVVEVLSDFVADSGVKVCYLDKVGGFVSLFQRASKSEDNTFLIRPDELYKFSHRVPYVKMTGAEREGVPVGSVELDPAAIPMKPEDLSYPSKVKVECINTASGSKRAVENAIPVDSKSKRTPKKSVDVEGVGRKR